ncbi:MAG TPA: NAD(P)/FAD-dependent oxidoreductase [Fimbriiglobus sp.]|jgi:flavin-dependent dehydrogenase
MLKDHTDYDAVIVGAGPAGLAAGIVLARNQLRVLVCDPHKIPIDKVCGEGILPPGLNFLRQLDVVRHLDPAETYPFWGIRIRTASGVTSAASFKEGPGLGVRRLNLSRALATTARQFPNLDWQESAVRGLSLSARHMDVQLRDRTVRTRLVIGADGLNSRTRRLAGLDGGRGRVHRLGARRHFPVAPWSDHVEVTHGLGIEAYVTPCGINQVGIAFLWDARRFGPVQGGPTLVPQLLHSFPELEDRLHNLPAASPPMGIGPLHRTAKRRTTDGVLLIGDAGGYLDACTGEGISLALAQALSLEKTVVPHLGRGDGILPRSRLLNYERACRIIVRPYLLATRILLFFQRHPRLFDRFVRTTCREPELLQWFFSAQMGTVPFLPGWERIVRLLRAIGKSAREKPSCPIG